MDSLAFRKFEKNVEMDGEVESKQIYLRFGFILSGMVKRWCEIVSWDDLILKKEK